MYAFQWGGSNWVYAFVHNKSHYTSRTTLQCRRCATRMTEENNEWKKKTDRKSSQLNKQVEMSHILRCVWKTHLKFFQTGFASNGNSYSLSLYFTSSLKIALSTDAINNSFDWIYKHDNTLCVWKERKKCIMGKKQRTSFQCDRRTRNVKYQHIIVHICNQSFFVASDQNHRDEMKGGGK